MLFLRVLGKTFLLIAFMALAYDGARMLASPGSGLMLTSFSKHLKAHFPEAQESLQQFALAYGPAYLWHGFIEPMLVLPVSLLFGVVGSLVFMAGYRRPPPEIAG